MSLADLADGDLGLFWPIEDSGPVDLQSPPLRGHLRIDSQWAMLEVLLEDDPVRSLVDGFSAVPAVAGILSSRTVVLLEMAMVESSARFGLRSSSRRDRARTVLTGADFDQDIDLRKLRSVSVSFDGVNEWAGATAGDERYELDSDGRPKAWSIKLQSPAPTTVATSSKGILSLTPAWSVRGSTGRRVLTTPTSIGLSFEQPRPATDLLKSVYAIQDLLSFLHAGFVPASSGSASLSGSDRVGLWNGQLMVPGAAVSVPTDRNQHDPLVTLEELGGLRTLARWVHLSEKHPRAVAPIAGRNRIGATSVELELMAAAAAIEYWVGVHRRTAAWSHVPASSHAHALAKHLGRSFARWVRIDAWAEKFWDTYNAIKHRPNHVFDPSLIADLARSGRLAITVALLNKASGTKSPGARIFSHHRLETLAERLDQAI